MPKKLIDPRSSITEETSRRIANALEYIAIADAKDIDITDYQQIANIVKAGRAKDFFEIGDQIHTTWQATGEEPVDLPWDVVDFGPATDPDGNVHENAMWLQSHYGTVKLAFSPYKAFYVTPEEMPAGTYHFMASTTINPSLFPAGTPMSFTISNNLPAGSLFYFGNGSSIAAPNIDRKIWIYSDATQENPVEVVDIVKSDDGTDLGLLGFFSPGDSGFNNLMECYGSTKWIGSAIRQWLNSNASAGEWYTPSKHFDRKFSNSQAGFLSQLPSDFIKIVKPTKITNKYYSTTGYNVEAVYDRFFIASTNQEYTLPDLREEGAPFKYWVDLLKEYQKTGSRNKKLEHIRYAAYSKEGSAVNVITRTVTDTSNGFGGVMLMINGQGILNGTNGSSSLYVVPCCVIY